MVDTVRIGGIKLREELVQFDFREPRTPDNGFIGLLERFFAEKANIPHLHQGAAGDAVQTTLCVSALDYPRLQRDIESDFAGVKLKKRMSTGTISVFPHGFDVSFVSRILHALSKRDIPIYGVSTSVSALVIHTEFTLLDEAVVQILTVCHLPENHTPLRPVIVLGDEEIETVAVYWEPRVRIYGMDLRSGLTDIQFTVSHKTLGNAEWRELTSSKSKFRLLTQQAVSDDLTKLSLLVDPEWKNELIEVLAKISQQDPGSALVQSEGHEMISFHGPHFQDRYGIAAMGFLQLMKNGISLTRSGCTGTSVHFVVGEGRGKDVSQCLEDTFVVPSSS